MTQKDDTANAIQSCLLQQTTVLLRKRKRTEKTVRFDIEHTVIIDTYSPSDYDRGSLFTTPIQYRINPAILAAAERASKNTTLIPKTTLLSVEIPSSPCDSEASSPDTEEAPTPAHSLSLNTNNHRKKKPKLTVDTSLCPGGPLFLTKLSTNHFKHRIDLSQYGKDQEDEDNSNDFLLPITPRTPAAASLS